MDKKHTIIILIFIMLYLLYNILSLKYDNYQENEIKQTIIMEHNKIFEENKKYKQIEIPYRKSRAFIDKLAKETSKYKNLWEDLFLVVEEKNYKKYRKSLTKQVLLEEKKEEKIYDTMTIFEKWMYFLFNKDIRDL